MKNTASTFIQYLENNKVDGSNKIAGYIIEKEELILQFRVFPTATEWLDIGRIWVKIFEQNISNLNLNKI